MLEAGDVVRFDSLVNDMKAYGEDYTEPVSRNGQTIKESATRLNVRSCCRY